MDTDELKFLLKLLGCANYHSNWSANIFSSIKAKNKVCQDLGSREIVDYTREISSVKILPPGKAVLNASETELPLTKKERKVLESISKASGKITPSKITPKSLKAAEREKILTSFQEKGLIELQMKRKQKGAEVWITERGLEYLREEYSPKGAATISLDLLGNYLRFLRKSVVVQPVVVPTPDPEFQQGTSITDEEILQTIRKLDTELGTNNYLPIFHLREKLQPPLSRDELDKALYRLEKNDQIELSTLLDPTHYTPEQVATGIPQNVGGSLFFISVY
ncbi:MAG: transcription factor RcaD [Calothrix sp. MO_192.B10]|nr:transcription factor RcaD [Calothrix sp. MO_192.B10]MDJ0797163.1 transcription factor RcaD [Calothrix sp. MO_167.B12]